MKMKSFVSRAGIQFFEFLSGIIEAVTVSGHEL